MSVSKWTKTVEKFTVDNSPMIMTAIGAAGTVTTAVLTGKAVLKADRLIQEEELQRDATLFNPLTKKEKFLAVWPVYVPPVVSGAITVTCIIAANRVGTKRAAAMAAAYTLSEKAYEEYREKIVEKLGVKKEGEARDEIAQDQIRRNPPATQIFLSDEGKSPFRDSYTGRYFMSTQEDVKYAINKINERINHHFYASLNELYQELGLDTVPLGEEVGWRDNLVEILITTCVTNDNKPCFVLTFQVEPVRDYFRAH